MKQGLSKFSNFIVMSDSRTSESSSFTLNIFIQDFFSLKKYKSHKTDKIYIARFRRPWCNLYVGATPRQAAALAAKPLLPLPASVASKQRACQLLYGSVLSSVRKTATSDFNTYLSPGFDLNEQAINE